MKTIGLIGGMSWESSIEYYRLINQEMRRRLGGVHSAKSLMYSVDFGEVEMLQHSGRWEDATGMMIDAALRLEAGGAECVVICTNTMHKMAEEVQAAVRVPLLHIADAAAAEVRKQGLTCVGLLGTRFTMEENFYTGRLAERFGLKVLIPDPAGREVVHRVIYDELVAGIINPASRDAYLQVIQSLADQGAQGIILGCTEIGLLVKDGDCRLPLFDTTPIHALAAVDWALADMKSE